MARALAGRSGLADDPVALEILWTRLVAIADEAAATLVRTSFSPIVRESNDFSCVVFDAAGNAIAENTIGIPSFNMTLSRSLQHVLRWRPAGEWRAGDVAITNDPWMASGHLPDTTVLMPVFQEDRLLAWTGSTAHMADIGGSIWSADTHQVFEEGLRIPPKLLFAQGRPNDDLLDLIRANVRLPDQVVGDVMAQVAAGRISSQRMLELTAEIGFDDLEEISREVCGRSEASMRRGIQAIPDGTYRADLDLDGSEDEGIHLEVAIRVQGDEMEVDYTGSSDEVSTSVNTVLNYTEAYTCYPLKCALDPDTPRNEGSYRPIRVIAPEGSILNPRYPAAVNARHVVGHCLSAVCYQALGSVIPERVMSESGSTPALLIVLSGAWPDRRRFTSILFVNGGMGARHDADGLPTTSFPSQIACGSMESIEATAPVRVWSKDLATDSGGPGRFRGGLGQDLELELISDSPATLSLLSERVKHPARGIFGGRPGRPARITLNGREGVPVKGRSRMRPGDRLRVEYPGGGGFGDPAERSRELLGADLEAGVVSEEAAREAYGWE
ncbi:MAG: hydantoinase B/oxoprolinase family protein [Candidatus Dormibacteraeota bacterium]|nr:hydantoinase B/oxoprolinase family protein [Candidatus Dormibacteraeota bacterium]MDQ6920020.1 hydantoinase B/oxoprolinase family protein [Candidatus Dormibacteraeota bacterium]